MYVNAETNRALTMYFNPTWKDVEYNIYLFRSTIQCTDEIIDEYSAGLTSGKL